MILKVKIIKSRVSADDVFIGLTMEELHLLKV